MAVLVPRMPTFSSFLWAASTHISNETLCTDNALCLHYLKLFLRSPKFHCSWAWTVSNFHTLSPVRKKPRQLKTELGNIVPVTSLHVAMSDKAKLKKKKMTPIYFYRHFITSVLAHATRLLWLASVVKHAYASQWLLNTPEEAHVRAWKIQWRQVSTGINVSVGQSCQIRLLSTGI